MFTKHDHEKHITECHLKHSYSLRNMEMDTALYNTQAQKM